MSGISESGRRRRNGAIVSVALACTPRMSESPSKNKKDFNIRVLSVFNRTSEKEAMGSIAAPFFPLIALTHETTANKVTTKPKLKQTKK